MIALGCCSGSALRSSPITMRCSGPVARAGPEARSAPGAAAGAEAACPSSLGGAGLSGGGLHRRQAEGLRGPRLSPRPAEGDRCVRRLHDGRRRRRARLWPRTPARASMPRCAISGQPGQVAVLERGDRRPAARPRCAVDVSASLSPDALRRAAAHFADPRASAWWRHLLCPAGGGQRRGGGLLALPDRHQGGRGAAIAAPIGCHGAFYMFRRNSGRRCRRTPSMTTSSCPCAWSRQGRGPSMTAPSWRRRRSAPTGRRSSAAGAHRLRQCAAGAVAVAAG